MGPVTLGLPRPCAPGSLLATERRCVWACKRTCSRQLPSLSAFVKPQDVNCSVACLLAKQLNVGSRSQSQQCCTVQCGGWVSGKVLR